MKIAKGLFLTVLLLAATAVAQYPIVPIDSIQWVPPGGDSSRYAGDTVRTGGLVVAGTGLYYAGGGVTFYMENPDGGPFSGIMAYDPLAQGIPPLVPGDSVFVTAYVSEYGYNGPPFVSHTELFILPGQFDYRMFGLPEPEPAIITASVIDSSQGQRNGEPYESVFTRINNLVCDTVIDYGQTPTWVCHDSTGICFIREASDSISGFRPTPGTVFEFVQGVIYHRFGAYHLQPRYMRDMPLGRGAPIIANVYNSPAFPLVSENVTLSANVFDDSHVDTVRLFYRINTGPWSNVPMNPVGNDRYTFSMPSPVPNWKVDYYIHAVDDSSLARNNPYEAPSSFYTYIVQSPRAMTIAEARMDADADFVPDKLDTAAILTGIAVSPSFSTTRTDFFMQQGNAAINVFWDSLVTVNPGDSFTVNGIIEQFTGKTQIKVYNASRLVYNGRGHMPETTTITCADLADINGEAYEGRLVRLNMAQILEIPNPWPPLGQNANLTIVQGADSATMFISNATDIDGQPQSQPYADIVGVVNQYDRYDPYLGFYEFMPRYYNDFQFREGIDDENALPQSYGLHQNYPNPFNPTTNISFTLRKTGRVMLTIYNVLGQKIATVFDKEMEAGSHIVNWNGAGATSGVYFYKLESDEFVQTKKMVLLK